MARSTTAVGKCSPYSAWPTVVAIIAFASVLAKGSGLLDDSDPYMHVAVGRWIIAHGAVPHGDVFSHSVPGIPWVAHEWLAEVLTAWVYDQFGWTGLVIAAGLAFAAALALLARALLRYLEPAYALIGVASAWGLCFPHLLARPHVFSFPLLVLWIDALVAARAKDRAPPYPYVLVMALWANLHGGYMLGLALAALFAAEAVFDASDWRGAWRAARGWLGFGALSLLAALATPNGISGMLLPFDLMGMHFALASISEWQSPDFQQPQPVEAWLMLVLLGAFLFGVRLPITRVLMLLLFLHLALTHQRHSEILGLVVPVLMAPALAPQLSGFKMPAGMADAARRTRAATLGLAAIALLAAAWPVRHGIAHAVDRFTPAAALSAAARAQVAGPVFNEYNFGGYLMFSGVAPFIDGRTDMYGDAFIRRYGRTSALPQLLAQYGITWTLLGPDNPRVAVLDQLPGWRRLYADKVSVVHVRDAAPRSEK